jgi:hypothetical protein
MTPTLKSKGIGAGRRQQVTGFLTWILPLVLMVGLFPIAIKAGRSDE